MTNTSGQTRATQSDNLIICVAKLLREDISIAYKSEEVWLRQTPINDDHDSWGGYERLEDWYYVAYSVIRAIDPSKASTALTDLVTTDSTSPVQPSNPPKSATKAQKGK